MKKHFLFIFFSVVFIIICEPCFAKIKPVVVVAPFDAKGVAQEEVDIITELFTAEYANTGLASVVDRNSFDKIKEQLKFQSSDWSNANKVAQLGKALNANHVVVGQLLEFRGRIITTIKIIDVNTTTILASYTERISDVEKVLDKIPSICKELSNRLGAYSMKYKIGDEGEGDGIVFYVSPTGFDVYDGQGGVKRCHYLEMSKTVLGESKWSDFDPYYGILNEKLGYGKSNTYQMINGMKRPSVEKCAAYRCIQYKTKTSEAGEWFLPNREEAELMMATQSERLGAESTKRYWTSDKHSFRCNNSIYYAIKYDGSTNTYYSVRAIRAF